MRSKIAVIVLLVAAAAGPAPAPDKGLPARKSADGVELPAALARKMQFHLPIIGDRLGGVPEQLGPKVYSTRQSAALLKKTVHRPGIDAAWFTMQKLAGADAITFDLTDGRVTSLALEFNRSLTKEQIQAMRRQIAPHTTEPKKLDELVMRIKDSPVTVVSTSSYLQFEVDPVEWQIQNHDTAADVAAAMRKREPVKGMTITEARCTFGKPSSTTDESDGVSTYTWHEYETIPSEPPVWGEDRYEHLIRVLGKTPRKKVTRRVTMDFAAGKATEFSDEKFDR